jgi:hypothetical protein
MSFALVPPLGIYAKVTDYGVDKLSAILFIFNCLNNTTSFAVVPLHRA